MTNPTDDGCFGVSVSAWADGVRSVTGRPHTLPPRGAELAKLVAAICTHCPDAGGREDWARAKAAAWAASAANKTIHAFVDWLNNGEQAPVARLGPRRWPKQGAGEPVPQWESHEEFTARMAATTAKSPVKVGGVGRESRSGR